MENLERIVPDLAEFRGKVLTRLDAIQGDIGDLRDEEREVRKTTLAEKAALIAAGGGVLAAIIIAVAQLAGGG